MDLIIQTGSERKHMLYSMGSHIIMRQLQPEFVSRPAILARDFAGELSGVYTKDTILYSYITLNDSLILRDITDNVPIIQLNANRHHKYELASMTVFKEQIILIFCAYDPTDNIWTVKYITHSPVRNTFGNHTSSAANENSFSNNVSASANRDSPSIDALTPTNANTILEAIPYRPHFSVLNTNAHLMLDINSDGKDYLWEITSDFKLVSHNDINETLKQQSVWQLDKIGSLQEDVDMLQQASSLMMNKINSLLNENEQLRNENTRLQDEGSRLSPVIKEKEDKLRALSDSLNETQKALTIREAQIESAKKQYNELMDVAEKYRDEAIKWRTALMSK
ncbi:MAG: hypothetical protein IJ661_07440 [Lachnospiraceae bacterium]|nr:hypothetical protein [Lachnospiraceae bacterium]